MADRGRRHAACSTPATRSGTARWWDFAVHHGPIDVACLPANGAVINYPKFQPAAEVGAVMGPAEAVARGAGARAPA